MDGDRNTAARILAPAALVAAFLALVIVIAGSAGGDGAGKATQDSAGSGKGRAAKTRTATGPRRRKTYVVKSGDNLSTIAETTGTPVERLTQLNPDADPQALISGQCIALADPADCK
jgi:pectate lyase